MRLPRELYASHLDYDIHSNSVTAADDDDEDEGRRSCVIFICIKTCDGYSNYCMLQISDDAHKTKLKSNARLILYENVSLLFLSFLHCFCCPLLGVGF